MRLGTSLRSRATAGAVALGLVATGLGAGLAPAAHAATSGTTTGTVSGATLTWGVKSSFRGYVVSPIAHGKITAGAGARQRSANGVFDFTGGTGSVKAGVGTVSFKGSARFTGHAGAMDVTLSNPRVVLSSGTTGELRADASVPASPTMGIPAFSAKNAQIATLTFSGANVASGKLELKSAAARLTATGSKAFGGFYSAGTSLDAVSFSGAYKDTRTATALKASASTSQYGTKATLTASGLPSGASVSFARGTAKLGQAKANSRGVAVLKAKVGGVGTQRITVRFAGNSAKKAASVTITAKVNKRKSATSVSAPKFKKNTKARTTVTVGRLADGTFATGSVSVTWKVPGKKTITKRYTLGAKAKGKLNVTAPSASKKAVKVKASYAGSSTTAGSSSAYRTIAVR